MTETIHKIKIQQLFREKSNRENLRRLYRFISSPQGGFILCQAGAAEQSKMLNFFSQSPLAERIYMLDMASAPLNLKSFQEKIIEVDDKNDRRKNIFLIYNIESYLKQLKIKEEDFFQRLNYIRDFFSRFHILFIFFFPERLLKVLFIHAFDFYDWFKLKVFFKPESMPVYESIYSPAR